MKVEIVETTLVISRFRFLRVGSHTNTNTHTNTRQIKKRSLKNFSEERWNDILATKQWNSLDSVTEDENSLDKMIEKFSNNVEEALNEIAPFKTFTVRSNHKYGLSEETKKIMKSRDQVRKSISKANHSEKATLQIKYKSRA